MYASRQLRCNAEDQGRIPGNIAGRMAVPLDVKILPYDGGNVHAPDAE